MEGTINFQEANFYKKTVGFVRGKENAAIVELINSLCGPPPNVVIVTSEIRPPDFDIEKYNREISERLKGFDYKDFLNE